jgi:glycosyltransferase involved in cell wall biosynthesis
MDFVRIRRKLVGTLEKIQPDLIWVNNEKSLVFTIGPLLKAHMALVLYFRGWGTANQIGPLLRFLLKHWTDGLIVHSPLIADRFVSYGMPPGKVFAIHNAVGLTAPEEELRKREIELPGSERKLKILLPAARPVRDKGHDVAIRALRRLKDKGEDAILWITGTIPTGVGQGFFNEVRAEVSHLGLEKDVHFLGWRDDLQAVIARSDVVIVPSRTEGFPRVIVEAMLLGVPICATPVGGVPEAIIDGKTGFLVEIGNDALLAEKVAQLASDAALRAAITKSARALTHEIFSLDIQTKAVTAVFNSIVENRKISLV